MTSLSDDPITAAFLVSLGGKWTTTCGCRTVTDLEQPAPHLDGLHLASGPERFLVSQHCLYAGAVSSSINWRGHFSDVTEAVTVALDHVCGPGLVTTDRWLRPGDDGYSAP